ncbi:MAG: tellurite resistance TerB family protein [Desulfovibrio sp.]
MSILDVLNSEVLGGALQQMSRQAGGAVRTAGRNAPGGMGGLMGAGAIGAILGSMAGGSGRAPAGLLGMGAVALNFYRKWAQAKQAEAAEPQRAPQQDPYMRDPFAQAGRVPVDPTSLLIMRAVIFAARADGSIDAAEQQRIGVLFQSLLQGQNVGRELEQMQKEPLDPRAIAREVRSEEQAEDVYRLSCCVIDIDQFMERTYLDALAASLGISSARKSELEAEASQGRRQLDAAVRG